MFSQEFIDTLAAAVADQVIAKLSPQSAGATQKRLLSTEEAASYLGLPSSSSLRQRKCAGQVPDFAFVKMGGSVLYDRQGLDKWIDEMKEAA